MTEPGVLVRVQRVVSCAGAKACDRQVCRYIAQPCAARYGFQHRTAILSSPGLDATAKERKRKLNTRQKGDRHMKTREQVDLELIDDNPWQPRQTYDEEGLQELADSIYTLGLLQVPLGRRTEGGRVQSAFGHRRVRSCRLLYSHGRGPQYIDMDLTEIDDQQMALMALTENEARKQLTQVEVVRAHKKAIEETGLTVQALADKLGINRSTLSNNLRALALPDFVLEQVESGALSIHVAREFLVLQNEEHVHTEEMQRVVNEIARTWGWSGAPDWSRRHVRQQIARAVSTNENDFRPVGPRTKKGDFYGGASREASFDIEAFTAERPEKMHTVPQDDDGGEKYGGSRTWTCDAKAWRSAQTRATRESNKEAVAAGQPTTTSTSQAPTRDQQLEGVLVEDPVWKAIAAARETPGRARPATDEEREQMGSRAELREISTYGMRGTFYKVLQKAQPQDIYSWQREDGGLVPPWFPDLKECQKCTIGAAYAKSGDSYGGGPRKPTLTCFNREHYMEKLQAGLATYKAKLEEQRTGMDRQDQRAMQKLVTMLEPIPTVVIEAIADSLCEASPELDLQHPLGVSHADFSYEGAPRAMLSEIGARWKRGGKVSEDSRKLTAALITHHLRAASKIETLLHAVAETTPTEAHNGNRTDDDQMPKGRLATWLDEQEDLDGCTSTEVLEKARQSLGDDVTASALGQSVHESALWKKVKTTNRAEGHVGVMFFRPRNGLVADAEAVSQGNG